MPLILRTSVAFVGMALGCWTLGCGSSETKPTLEGAADKTAKPQANASAVPTHTAESEPVVASPLPAPVKVPPPPAPPQINGKRPAVVAAFRSVDKLVAEIKAIDSLGLFAPRNLDLQQGIKPWLAALDGSRPLGLFSLPDTQSARVVEFLPLKDTALLKKVLSERFGQITEMSENRWLFGGNWAVVVGDWVFIADRSSDLENLPPDPAALLEGLSESHSFVLRLDPSGFPEESKEKYFADLRQRVTETNPIQREASQQVAKTVGNYLVDYLVQLVDGTHVAELALSTDATKRKMNFQIRLVPAAGSSLSQQLATPLPAALPLAGFRLPNAMFSMRRAAVVSPLDRKFESEFFKGLQADDEERFSFNPDINEASRETKRASLLAQRPLLQVLLGDDYVQQAIIALPGNTRHDPFSHQFHVLIAFAGSRTKPTTEGFKAFMSDWLSDEYAQKPQVTYDIARVGDITLHRIVQPQNNGSSSTPLDKRLRDLFGESKTMVVGTAPGRLYLAVGPDAEKHLRTAIESNTGSPSPQNEALAAELSAVHLIDFLERTFDLRIGDPAKTEVDQLRQSDKLTMKAVRSPQHWSMEGELEPGMLRLAVALASKAATPVEPLIPRRWETMRLLPRWP